MPVNNKKEATAPAQESTEIAELKKENEELKKNIESLMEKMTQLLEAKAETPVIESVPEEDDSLKYKEPDANKQVRLVSMYYGVLTLCNSANRNTAKTLKFSKFGEIKSVLYHDLVDYVNNEHKFAEQGYFYILDKAAVYYLGLSSEYEKLVSPEFINNIMSYTEVEIHDVVSTMTPVQQDNLVEVLSNRMFRGESMDMNKIDIINKITGKNIQNKVEEMKKFTDMATR